MRAAEYMLFAACSLSAVAPLGCAADDDPKAPQPADADATAADVERADRLIDAGDGGADQAADDGSDAAEEADGTSSYDAAQDADVSGAAGSFAVASTLELGGEAPVLSICARGGIALVGRALAPGPTPELAIVNVSIPEAPWVVGSIDVEASVRAVVLEGTRAYAATSDTARELLIADVSDPAQPAVIGGFDVPGTATGASLDVAGYRVVLGLEEHSGPELVFLDATDPAGVIEDGSYEVSADVNDVATNASVAYIATSDPGAEFVALGYVGSPLHIVKFGSLDAANGPARAIDVNEGRVYVVAGSEEAAELLMFAEGKSASLVDSAPLGQAPSDVMRYAGSMLSAGSHGIRTFGPSLNFESELLLDEGISSIGLDRHNVLLGSAATGRIHIARARPPLRVEDRTADGVGTLSVLGDSISKTADSQPTWVDEVAARLPSDWRVINHAQPGASTYFGFDPTMPNAWTQLETALAADEPDVFALAFGPNDVQFVFTVAETFGTTIDEASIDDLARQIVDLRDGAGSQGAVVYVALTQPQNQPAGDARHELVSELNHRLRNDIDPAFTLDFFSTIVAPDDFVDAVHLAASGQSKRATETLLMLLPE